MMLMSRFMVGACAALLVIGSAQAQWESGSNGSDGPFEPNSPNYTVDLGQAADGSWDSNSPVMGKGIYDAAQWAVVFHYTTITIPEGVTVTFRNHRSGAPVVWLAQGDVNIAGVVNLDGQDY
jgi:hypothetical protein